MRELHHNTSDNSNNTSHLLIWSYEVGIIIPILRARIIEFKWLAQVLIAREGYGQDPNAVTFDTKIFPTYTAHS